MGQLCSPLALTSAKLLLNCIFMALGGLGCTWALGAAQWVPPVGIPAPSFGITNSHWMYTNGAFRFNYGSGPVVYRTNQYGPYTHYIDNTHPAATDTANPNGTPTKPRHSVPNTLAAGSVVQILGGPYTIGQETWNGAGSANMPVFILGIGMPRITGAGDLVVTGSYVLLEEIELHDHHISSGAGSSHIAFRRLSVNGLTGGFGTAIGADGSYFVVFDCDVFDNGDSSATDESDLHGLKPTTGDSYHWYLNNRMHGHGGDSVQIGSATASEPWATHIYVGGNIMYADRENAVDIKQARNVVISQNTMHSYRQSSSSSGEAVVVHNGSENVWIINNVIYEAERGIVSTGVSGNCYVVGNLVRDCSEYGMYLDRGGGTWHVYNNTVVRSPHGIYTGNSVAALHYRNNLVAELTSSSGYHLYLANSGVASSSSASNFLFYQTGGNVRLRWGSDTYTSVSSWVSGSGEGVGSLIGNPRFIDPDGNNFHVDADSPGIDAGVNLSQLDATYMAFFGASLLRDLDGTTRPQGSAQDIGAYEFLAGQMKPVRPMGVRLGQP